MAERIAVTEFRVYAPSVSLLARLPAYGFLGFPFAALILLWAGDRWYVIALAGLAFIAVGELLILRDRARQYVGVLTNVDVRIDFMVTRPAYMRLGRGLMGMPDWFTIDYVDVISTSLERDRVTITYARSDGMERKTLVMRVVDAGRLYGELEARIRASLDSTEAAMPR